LKRPVVFRHRDGFTLTELLVVMSIIGFIGAAIAVTISVVLRTAPSTEARADDARTLLGVTTYLPRDVSSTPIDEPDVDPSVSENAKWDTRQGTGSCASTGEIDGRNVLTLNWTQAGVGYTANYRFLTRESDDWRLYRVYCQSGSPANVTGLTADLPAPGNTSNPTWTLPVAAVFKLADADADGDDDIVGVSLTLTTEAGDSLRFDGSSNNPAQFLPPVPPQSGGGGTGSDPCVADITSVSPLSVPNQNQPNPSPAQDQNPGPLKQPVEIAVNDNGNCGSLVVVFDTDPANPNNSISFVYVENGTARIDNSSSLFWTDGDHTLSLRDGYTSTTPLGLDETLEVV
jgi:prepilin-type N-terminal cleavage/methylation domain-containing protein